MQNWALFGKELINLNFFMSLQVHYYEIDKYWCLKCWITNSEYRLIGKFPSEDEAYELLKRLYNV